VSRTKVLRATGFVEVWAEVRDEVGRDLVRDLGLAAVVPVPSLEAFVRLPDRLATGLAAWPS